MNHSTSSSLSRLQFYVSAPYPCSYLPDQIARSEVLLPGASLDTARHSELVRAGFRRSGCFVYRPHCEHCHACTPTRVLATDFCPSRSQQRAQARHRDLQVSWVDMGFSQEHYNLYCRYQTNRHPGGGMDEDDRMQYTEFLLRSQAHSAMVEFREAGVLRMVSVIDFLDNGLSSVYTFFEPNLPRTSFGIYNVMWQIQQCQARQLPYLYLGYWIKHSRKMAYKAQFRPLQILIDNHWQLLDS